MTVIVLAFGTNMITDDFQSYLRIIVRDHEDVGVGSRLGRRIDCNE
jgi:hypothetical protein